MDPVDNNSTGDEAEWGEAGLEFLSDRNIEPDKRKEEQGAIQDESAKPKEGNEDEGAKKTDSEDQKPDEKSGTGDDTKEKAGADTEDGKPTEKPAEKVAEKVEEDPAAPAEPTAEQADRDYRRRQLELEADRKELAVDVRKRMFSDVPAQLQDADGDPIETIADVMKLQNPLTGKIFTVDEATQWLLQAQRHFEKEQDRIEKQVGEIVEANLSVKEQADAVRAKYGELLENMPKLRARIWAEYKKTLVFDEKSEIITRAPVSMEAFYGTILAPYVKEAQRLQKESEAAGQAKVTEEAAAQKKKVEEEKTHSRSDREDVISTRTKIEDISDPEEREWAEAAKEHYEK